jgi:DNA repair exonuclease SbcCD ATPase subunit
MKYIYILALSFLILACGSSEQVIYDGSVYEIKGDKIYKRGEKVNESLSDELKTNIRQTLDARLALEKEIEAKKEALEAEQKAQEKALKEAENALKKAEQAQKALEKALEKKEKLREAFIDANSKYKDQKDKYERLHDAGKLSPNDEEKWAKRLDKLKSKMEEAERKLNNN